MKSVVTNKLYKIYTSTNNMIHCISSNHSLINIIVDTK